MRKIINSIVSRLTMKRTDKKGFSDIVSGYYVSYYEDNLGNEWMAIYPFYPWSFRVKCIENKLPNDGFIDSINRSVSEDLKKRSIAGFKKYNKTMDRSDLSYIEWLQHQYEELLDAAVYTKKIINKLSNKE